MKRFFQYILFILFLFACEGNKNKQEEKETNSTKNIISFDLQGHRGGRGLMPENTVPAFLKALDYQVTTLELDVVISKDSHVIISHEPFLSPEICLEKNGEAIVESNPPKYNIYEMTLEEIYAFDCGSKKHPSFLEQEKMRVNKPSLNEVVLIIEREVKTRKIPQVFYNIETKSTPKGDNIFHPRPKVFAELLYKTLQELQILDRVFIQSFDVRTLQEFRKIDTEIPLVLLIENGLSFEENLEKLAFTPAVYSPYYELVTKELITKCKEKNIKITPWTVNEKSDMKKLKEMGVDGLITDYPNRYREIDP